jgi:hypothetical protein
MGDIGSAQYVVKPNDTIWWDFHSWEGEQYMTTDKFNKDFLNSVEK